MPRPVSSICLAVLLVGCGAALAQEPAPERRQALTHLLKQECGSCHGMTLKGGLGPALGADALAGKDDEALVATILLGRPGTAMPGWERFLDEAEARWLVRQLKRGATHD